jgi:hypothetical protein
MTYTVDGYKRLNRRVAGTDQPNPGPWHAMLPGRYQSWCGSKVRGFNARISTTKPEGEVLCTKCEKAVACGRPTPFSRR